MAEEEGSLQVTKTVLPVCDLVYTKQERYLTCCPFSVYKLSQDAALCSKC